MVGRPHHEQNEKRCENGEEARYVDATHRGRHGAVGPKTVTFHCLLDTVEDALVP